MKHPIPANVEAAIKGGLLAAARQDEEGMAEAIEALAQAGPRWVFTACWTWAEAIRDFGGLVTAAHGFWGFEVAESDDGPAVEPEDLPADAAPTLWCGRFLSANLNQDFEVMSALFLGLDDMDAAAERAEGLMRMAGSALASSRRGQP